MVSDHDRHDLFLALRRHLGDRPADTMMELLPPVGWSDVARRSDVAELRAELKHELAGFELRLAAMETRLMTMNIATALAVGGLVLAAVKLA